MHSGDECQKYWRDRFAEQLEEAIERDWGLGPDDPQFESARWFREGVKFASIIIRWDYDDEAPSDDQP